MRSAIRTLFAPIILTLLHSCAPKPYVKLDLTKFEYRSVVHLINSNFVGINGKTIQLDTTGHPSLDSLLRRLDKYSRLTRLSTQGTSSGELGIQIDFSQDIILVLNVIEGGPADRAGILAMDQLTRIDGQEVSGMPPEKVIELLRGDIGSKASITLLREYTKQLTYSMEREIINPHSLSSCLYLDSVGIGYIRISSFEMGAAAELASCLKRFQGTQLKGLLLDLRRNQGGYLQEVVNSAELFLKEKSPICEVRGNPTENTIYKTARRDGRVDFACVILVDQFTASGAELMAGALQENKRSILVGTRTLGNGVIQRAYELSDTLQLRLTTGYMFLPSGNSFHQAGLQPNHVVKSSRNAKFPRDNIELINALKDSSDIILYAGFGVFRKLR